MGYRSDVTMVVKSIDDRYKIDNIIHSILLAKPEYNEAFKELVNSEYLIYDSYFFKYAETSVKFYDSIIDTQLIMEIWNYLKDKENVKGSLVRIGEDDTDIESDHFDNTVRSYEEEVLSSDILSEKYRYSSDSSYSYFCSVERNIIVESFVDEESDKVLEKMRRMEFS